MSLTANDAYILENWFCELQLYSKESDQYFAKRDKIYSYIYERLNDLLKTKQLEWYKKYYLKEDDCHSIFSDTLLSCVDNYKPKRVKFITYFWESCENAAKNYYKHYRRQRRIPPSHLVDMDFSRLLSDSKTDKQADNLYIKDVIDHLRNLYDKESENADIVEQTTHLLEILRTKLTLTERNVLDRLVEGYKTKEISALLKLDLPAIKKATRIIKTKAEGILQLNDRKNAT